MVCEFLLYNKANQLYIIFLHFILPPLPRVLSLVQGFLSHWLDYSHGSLAFSSPHDVDPLWNFLHVAAKLFYDNKMNLIMLSLA